MSESRKDILAFIAFLFILGSMMLVAKHNVTAKPPFPQGPGYANFYFKFISYQELAPGQSVSIDFTVDSGYTSQLNPCAGSVAARDPVTGLPPADQRLDITCRVIDIGKARIWITNNGSATIAIYQRAGAMLFSTTIY